jgi:hypothetical protein
LAAIQHDERFNRLDQNIKDFIGAIAENRDYFSQELNVQTVAISELHRQTELQIANHINQTRTDILEAMKSSDSGPRDHSISDSSLVHAMKINDDTTFRENAILQHLGFPSRYDRYENVTEAHVKTFNWIFEESTSKERAWSGFTEWLKGEDSIYWIHGKAGSGKSTLMKYICEDSRTPKLLAQWGGTDKYVLMVAFFFWVSGTPDQSSQIGLLRSLLYDILSQRRNLIPFVFPDEWTSIDPKIPETYPRRSWTLHYTHRALKALFKLDVGKIALFIDGLDEYSGDHTDIIQLFESIQSPDVKLCLSSRPLVDFQDAFYNRPKLKLQDLTFNDVKIYVDDRLAENKMMKNLTISEPIQAPHLVHEIVSKADGVFLWVTPVVRSLLNGLRNRDQISDLQRRLRLIPTEISALYHYMLTHIQPFYLEEGSRLFQLMSTAHELQETGIIIKNLNNSEPLSMLGMYFANNDGAAFNIHGPIKPLSQAEAQEKIDETDYRLKICCAGLLEMGNPTRGVVFKEAGYDNRRVEYLHRSTKDYLELPEVRQLLAAATLGTKFNSSVALLRSTLLLTKSYHFLGRRASEDRNRLVAAVLLQARQVEKETKEAQTKLLDEFDRAVLQILPSETHYAHEVIPVSPKYVLAECNDDDTDLGTSCDFFSLAISFQLVLYVEAKLQHDESIIQDKQGIPYLSYTLVFWPSRVERVNKRIVELLLSHGSDPNRSFHGNTPWKAAIASVLDYHFSVILEGRLDESEWKEWVYVFKLLLEHGADVNDIMLKRQGAPYTDVSQVIETCFRNRFLEETAELLALVKKIRKEGQKSLLQETQQGPHESPAQKKKPSAISRSKLWLEKKLLRSKK